MVINSLARKARDFFFKAHKETKQTYGKGDDRVCYTFHLEHVADVVRFYAPKVGLTDDETDLAIAAAYGHDGVSDARLTFNDIQYATGSQRLAQICCNLCEDVWGVNRNERNSDSYYERISSDKISVFVKICDRIANVEYGITNTNGFMSRRYKEENYKFRNKLFSENFIILWDHLDNLFRKVH